jgi:hypothetical protein
MPRFALGVEAPSSYAAFMVELEKSKDPVRLSFLQALLTDAGIESSIFDQESPWPGVLPGRLMVDAEDLAQAKRIIAQAPPAYP